MSAGSEDRELAAIAERAREIALQTRLAAAESEVAGLRAVLERYQNAILGLSKIKDGKTLFEGSPTKDDETYRAWVELNDAGVEANKALALRHAHTQTKSTP